MRAIPFGSATPAYSACGSLRSNLMQFLTLLTARPFILLCRVSARISFDKFRFHNRSLVMLPIYRRLDGCSSAFYSCLKRFLRISSDRAAPGQTEHPPTEIQSHRDSYNPLLTPTWLRALPKLFERPTTKIEQSE